MSRLLQPMFLLVPALLCTIMVVNPVRASVPLGYTWPTDQATLSLHTGSFPDGSSVQRAVLDGANLWNMVCGSDFEWFYNTASCDPGDQGDGCNGVAATSLDPDLLGSTLNSYLGSTLVESDVWFNSDYSFWLYPESPCDTSSDPPILMYVAMHEFGHALGLDHTAHDGLAVMQDTYHGGLFGWNDGDGEAQAHADDALGLRSLYPGSSQCRNAAVSNWEGMPAVMVACTPTAQQGQEITVRYTGQNLGALDMSDLRVDCYLSTNEIISTGDTHLRTEIWSYPANGYGEASMSVTIPECQTPGTYWVGIFLDPLNAYTESRETDNALAACCSIEIGASNPDQPILAFPPNGAADQPTDVCLDWNFVSGAASYDVQIGTDCTSGSVFTASSSFYCTSGLSPSTTYEWRVRARNVCGAVGPWSSCRSFTTMSVPPDIAVSPSSIELTLPAGENGSTVLLVQNTVPGSDPLEWSIRESSGAGFARPAGPSFRGPLSASDPALDGSEALAEWRQSPDAAVIRVPKGAFDTRTGPLMASGGPDLYGYTWSDSDEADGPAFAWNDIQGVGVALSLTDDDVFDSATLPFEFPFYGASYNTVKIASNGYLTFEGGNEFDNQPIPTASIPNALVAGFWDDLNPQLGGSIHYYADGANDRFIVQYTGVARFGDASATHTFQIILEENGTILFQYQDVPESGSTATIGIEDLYGSDGLQVGFNDGAARDGLAIRIQDACPWLWVVPAAGSISGSGSDAVDVLIDGSLLQPGAQSCDLIVASNDPDEPEVLVPVTVNVTVAAAMELSRDHIYLFALEGEQASETMEIRNLPEFAEELTFRIQEGVLVPRVQPYARSAQQSGPSAESTVEKGALDDRRGTDVDARVGGPDGHGYTWIDSNEASGPAFSWVEISGVGTPVALSDDDAEQVALPFPFPFYDYAHEQVWISSNGYLTFGSAGGVFNNEPIPTALVPNDMIAPFWRDLNPEDGGSIYYYHDVSASRFIVQYSAIPPYGVGGASPSTFQVILEPSGAIQFQYLDMQGPVESATVGIENPDGAEGLEVVFNAAYLEDGLAVRFEDGKPYFWSSPVSGAVAAEGMQSVEFTLDATNLTRGNYDFDMILWSNDPLQPQVVVPVTLGVLVTSDAEPLDLPTTAAMWLDGSNPVRDVAALRFDLPKAARVRAGLYDTSGRRLSSLLDAGLEAGRHRLSWDGTDAHGHRVAPGVYFVRMESDGFSHSEKLVVLR